METNSIIQYTNDKYIVGDNLGNFINHLSTNFCIPNYGLYKKNL